MEAGGSGESSKLRILLILAKRPGTTGRAKSPIERRFATARSRAPLSSAVSDTIERFSA